MRFVYTGCHGNEVEGGRTSGVGEVIPEEDEKSSKVSVIGERLDVL